MEVTTIEELQDKAGLLATNKTGIIYRSVAQSDLEDLLKDYIETADFHMYYDYGNRLLTRRYEHAYVMDNLNYIESAIYYALKSNEYRLQTLITSTELDYNPIDNYAITESIVTTATIASNSVRGAQENNKNIGQITTTDKGTNSKQHGAISENGTNNTTYGAVSETGSENTKYGQATVDGVQTTDYGTRTESGNDTMTKSVFNDNDYQPYEKHITQNTKQSVQDTVTNNEIAQEHTDTVSTSKSVNERTDTNTTSKTINARTDSDSINMTKTQNAYDIKDNLGERTDNENRKDNIDRQRKVNGRYGYTSTQALIQAERDIANLSIVEEIIKIVLKTIALNVLFID